MAAVISAAIVVGGIHIIIWCSIINSTYSGIICILSKYHYLPAESAEVGELVVDPF